MTDENNAMIRAARDAFGTEPDASEVANTPTTFRRVFAPLAAVALVAAVLAVVLMGGR